MEIGTRIIDRSRDVILAFWFCHFVLSFLSSLSRMSDSKYWYRIALFWLWVKLAGRSGVWFHLVLVALQGISYRSTFPPFLTTWTDKIIAFMLYSLRFLFEIQHELVRFPVWCCILGNWCRLVQHEQTFYMDSCCFPQKIQHEITFYRYSCCQTCRKAACLAYRYKSGSRRIPAYISSSSSLW